MISVYECFLKSIKNFYLFLYFLLWFEVYVLVEAKTLQYKEMFKAV